MSTVPERADVDAAYKWDLESIYPDDEAWEQAHDEVQSSLDDLRAYEERVTPEGADAPRFPDGDALHDVLELEEDVMRRVSKLTAYARMRADEDTRDQEAQALAARGRSLASEASSAASFVEPAVQALTRAELDGMVESTPALETYDHYLDDVMRMKAHTRSAEVESLLSELGEVLGAPSDIYGMLTNADMTFPTVERPDGDSVEITPSNFTKLQKHPDRAFRREVYEAFYDEFETVRNTVGAALKHSVKTDVKGAQIRGYDTAREAAMDGPNVPVEVYDTLLETVRDNLDVLHRHAEMKRDALGVDTLGMHDLYMPLVDTEQSGPEIEYEDACGYVVEAVAPLGEAYQERVARGLESRWVDVYENRGKRSGAYSGGTYDTQLFILLNYQDDVTSMFTLAHELGHSLHSQLTSEHQPYTYADYEIFVAEVASTVNETLLTHHLLDAAPTDELRRHVLNEYLERFRATLYRQTMFADFEHTIHTMSESGEPLTPDRLDARYRELKETFYEPADVDDRIAREWMRIPHFYYDYYVYQYATGISAAAALVDDVLETGEPAAARYREFLQRGSRAYPLELLRDAGVDMATAEPVERAIGVYDSYLDEMAALL